MAAGTPSTELRLSYDVRPGVWRRSTATFGTGDGGHRRGRRPGPCPAARFAELTACWHRRGRPGERASTGVRRECLSPEADAPASGRRHGVRHPPCKPSCRLRQRRIQEERGGAWVDRRGSRCWPHPRWRWPQGAGVERVEQLTNKSGAMVEANRRHQAAASSDSSRPSHCATSAPEPRRHGQARDVEIDGDELGLIAFDDLNPSKVRVLSRLARLESRSPWGRQRLFNEYEGWLGRPLGLSASRSAFVSLSQDWRVRNA
jgi:hypothetical protein